MSNNKISNTLINPIELRVADIIYTKNILNVFLLFGHTIEELYIGRKSDTKTEVVRFM